MKIYPSRYPLFGLLLCLFAVFPPSGRASGDDWKPIEPAHLALKNATVEKDADAEALFWEIRIDDNPEGDLIFNHYIRVKVFTDRGPLFPPVDHGLEVPTKVRPTDLASVCREVAVSRIPVGG